MKPRWMVERLFANREREVLQTVIVYPEGVNKETVKQENKGKSYKRELIFVG